MHTLFCIVASLLMLLAGPARAQDEPEVASEPEVVAEPEAVVLRVATKPFSPFVIDNGGDLEGFSIELWEYIAHEIEVETEWVQTSSVEELLTTIQGEPTADVAIAGITITATREASVDFSHPYFHTGLQVMVASSGESTSYGVLRAVLNPALLKAILGLVLFLLVAAHALWFFERKHNPEMFPPAYVAGIWEAFWWSAVTVTTVGYGDKTPKSVPGRLIGVVWMFAGLLFLGYFTASITTVLTAQQSQTNIAGPGDLVGRSIGTVGGTTAADYLDSRGAKVVEFATLHESVEALLEHSVDAVVYDAPALRYYSTHEGEGSVRVVGPTFKEQSYGVGLPEGSPYREPISRALLELRENGVYDKLHSHYFGD